jgi:probable phosphomutase (TIGR03848 family)
MAGSVPVQLLLIRHASNDWLGKRLPGWAPGLHLNDQGRAEAALLGARLVGHPVEAVYSSPLERATETAAFVARPHGLEVSVLEGLGEVRCGAWEGQDLDSVRADPLWPRLIRYPSGTAFPGGETLSEVQARARAVLDDVLPRHQGCVAVVSHADVIKAMVAHYLGSPLDLSRRFLVAPASVTVFELTGHGPHLVLFGDTGTVPVPLQEGGSSGTGAPDRPGGDAGQQPTS